MTPHARPQLIQRGDTHTLIQSLLDPRNAHDASALPAQHADVECEMLGRPASQRDDQLQPEQAPPSIQQKQGIVSYHNGDGVDGAV